jgi:gentisate 1,2-dioxygenase
MAKVATHGATHYDVQKRRRAAMLDEWRKTQRVIVHSSEVSLAHSPLRRMSSGTYKGLGSARPSLVMDASVHELASGETTTVHRHSWDAIAFVVSGSGWTEIDGTRVNWKPWDTLYLPSWAWHRHCNVGQNAARLLTWSVQPLFEYFGAALIEDGGDEPVSSLPSRPSSRPPARSAGDPYAARWARLAERSQAVGRLHTAWDDVVPRVTKRGARSMFLVDQSIGYRTSGITAVMHELAPGLWQAGHKHGGEALLYIASGRGHTTVDGTDHPWEAGDLVVVDHWCWHQHCNDDQAKTARVIRVHSSLGSLMRVLLDPLPISEENPEVDRPDLSNVSWPDANDGRPTE